MTKPDHQSANTPSRKNRQDHTHHPDSHPVAGLKDVADLIHYARDSSYDGHPLSPAHARHLNTRRASYAAAALQHHVHLSDSRPDTLKTALTELLTDIHHLYDICDVDTDLATLFKVAALVHTRETQPS